MLIQDFELGLREFESQNYDEALRLLLPYAQEGNPEAQCIVANMHHLKLIREPCSDAALKWYTLSSSEGYAIATNNLAGICLVGECGVEPDMNRSQVLYDLAQSQGFRHELQDNC